MGKRVIVLRPDATVKTMADEVADGSVDEAVKAAVAAYRGIDSDGNVEVVSYDEDCDNAVAKAVSLATEDSCLLVIITDFQGNDLDSAERTLAGLRNSDDFVVFVAVSNQGYNHVWAKQLDEDSPSADRIDVVDTAGLRDPVEEVERIGVARSWAEIEGADAIVFLHDLTRLGEPGYEAADAAIAARLPVERSGEGRVLHVFNKVDLLPSASADHGVVVSAATGEGLEALRARLLAIAGWQAAPEGLFIARARHVYALERARAHLEEAGAHSSRGNAALELFAEELRLAHDALGEITGAFTADDLLGAIFGRFCIGK